MDKNEQWLRFERFHAHLDQCWQCREHPFELCSEGVRLIERVEDQSVLKEKERRTEALRPNPIE